ncbi:uncharacterized protein LOC124168648 [Ischnura elegans]|uniref:uncharacterized protein LOC124168648 n=1 Tax=Ischnura elegans TaxID=197161 RepID=UPI001ED874FC|nr:uncharacterized protein LOC124168648 [Ischnura elegans]
MKAVVLLLAACTVVLTASPVIIAGEQAQDDAVHDETRQQQGAEENRGRQQRFPEYVEWRQLPQEHVQTTNYATRLPQEDYLVTRAPPAAFYEDLNRNQEHSRGSPQAWHTTRGSLVRTLPQGYGQYVSGGGHGDDARRVVWPWAYQRGPSSSSFAWDRAEEERRNPEGNYRRVASVRPLTTSREEGSRGRGRWCSASD